MRLLKALVIGMGVLLAAGLVVIVVTIVARLSRMASAPASTVAEAPGATNNSITLPSGASIRSLSLDGSRLAVGYGSSDGEGVVILDVRTGAEIARFTAAPSQK